MSRRLAPPEGGEPPPAACELGDGQQIDLGPPAEHAAERYFATYPDDVARYGEAGRAWCVHDSRWLLAWALEDALTGWVDCVGQVRWLGRVLVARDYPLDRLVRHVEIVADVLDADVSARDLGRQAAARMRQAAAALADGR